MHYELNPLDRAYLEYDKLFEELQAAGKGKVADEIRSKIRALRIANRWTGDSQSLLAQAARIKQAVATAESEDAPSVVSTDGS